MLELIKDNINRGIYPLDYRLPSERKLAAEFGVPQSQVRKALKTLVDEGYLECLRNNGYFVKKNRPTSQQLLQVAFCLEDESRQLSGENFYTGMLFNHAMSYNINLLAFQLPKSSKAQNSFFLDLIERNIQGVICFPHLVEQFFPALLELKKRSIPLIFWDYSPFHSIFPSVGVDHYQSCFRAAGILSELKEPATYIGFKEKAQNELKYMGFTGGCDAFNVTADKPILLDYGLHFQQAQVVDQLRSCDPGKNYFTSTRLLTQSLIGSMLDRGYMPGRDYRLLGTDTLKMMEGSTFQVDCMMRDRESIMHNLLTLMRDMLNMSANSSYDYRIVMKYIPGQTLHKSSSDF